MMWRRGCQNGWKKDEVVYGHFFQVSNSKKSCSYIILVSLKLSILAKFGGLGTKTKPALLIFIFKKTMQFEILSMSNCAWKKCNQGHKSQYYRYNTWMKVMRFRSPLNISVYQTNWSSEDKFTNFYQLKNPSKFMLSLVLDLLERISEGKTIEKHILEIGLKILKIFSLDPEKKFWIKSNLLI